MEGKLFATTIKTLAPQFKLKSGPNIDNFAFKLHYKATVILLVVFVILVCSREFFGEHIKCISDKDKDTLKVIETYCFFMATFTIVRHYDENLFQTESIPHTGVGPLHAGDKTVRHTYYQWIPFVLFLQSLAFYMPHYIWKKKEGGRIQALVDGLQYAKIASNDDDDLTVKGNKILSKKNLEKKLEIIRKDIIMRLRLNRTWSVWMVSMEVINLLHVILQIYMINFFLNGQFLDLGPKVIGFANWKNDGDPLEIVFPKVTKCTFHKYGSGGSLQQHDALCIMALNIIHEKIYIILWFWFLILLIVSVIAIVWRIISVCLYRRSQKFNELMFRNYTGRKLNYFSLFRVVNSCQYSDWLFLYYLATNMQGFIFRQLFSRLAEELEKKEVEDEKKGDNTNSAAYDDTTLPMNERTASVRSVGRDF